MFPILLPEEGRTTGRTLYGGYSTYSACSTYSTRMTTVTITSTCLSGCVILCIESIIIYNNGSLFMVNGVFTLKINGAGHNRPCTS